MQLLIASLLALWAGVVVYDLMPIRRGAWVGRVNELLEDGEKEAESISMELAMATIIGKLFTRFTPTSWFMGTSRKLYWAQRAGKWKGWRPADIWGVSVGAAVFGWVLMVFLGTRIQFALLVAAIMFFYPAQKLDTDYQNLVSGVLQELPGMVQNVALVVGSGASLEEALRRVSVRQTPLAAWLRDVLARSAGKSLFSNPMAGVQGFLLQEARKSKTEELVFMATQMDLIYQRGTDTWELLNTLALKVTRRRQAQIERKAEALDNKLVIPVMIFFFVPYAALLLYPPLHGAMHMFG